MTPGIPRDRRRVFWGLTLLWILASQGSARATAYAADERVALQATPQGDRASVELRHPDLPDSVFVLRLPEHVVMLKGLVPRNVRWTKIDDRRWQFRWEAAPEIKQTEQTDFWGEIACGVEELSFQFVIHNPTDRPWSGERSNAFDVMTGQVPAFHDEAGQRTMVRVGPDFISLREALRGELSPDLGGRMVLAKDTTRPRFREYTERLTARTAREGSWLLALGSDSAQGATFNLQAPTSSLPQNRTWAPLQPHETCSLRGKVYLLQGSLEDLRQRFEADRGRWAGLRETWRSTLGLLSPSNVVVGRLDHAPVLCLQGADAKTRGASTEWLDAQGGRVGKNTTEPGLGIGNYLLWIDLPPQHDPWLLYSFIPKSAEAAGGARLVRVRDGSVVKEIQNVTHFGNNPSIVADLDQDGTAELVYADQKTLTCYELPSCRQRWRFDDGVVFCWSLPALVDVDGDQRPDIVFGSEYNNAAGDSSMIAINGRGERLWRTDGHSEDLGSTPVFPADVDGDGAVELIKVGLDLEHRLGQRWNHIHVFDLQGQRVRKIEFGCTGLALGDMDGDGKLEGVGLTNSRDGGNHGHREIRCVDLATGRLRWTIPVPRAYLDTNSPLMIDVDGDGSLEAIVGTGNPSGYARLPRSDPWGDLYVVGHDGDLRRHLALPGWPVNLAQCDLDDDGLSELMVVIDGQPGWLAAYKTSAPTTRRDWPTPFGSPSRRPCYATRFSTDGRLT